MLMGNQDKSRFVFFFLISGFASFWLRKASQAGQLQEAHCGGTTGLQRIKSWKSSNTRDYGCSKFWTQGLNSLLQWLYLKNSERL